MVKRGHQQTDATPAPRPRSAVLFSRLAASGAPGRLWKQTRGGRARSRAPPAKACLWLPPAPAPVPSTPRKRTGFLQQAPKFQEAVTTPVTRPPGASRPPPRRGSPRALSHLQAPLKPPPDQPTPWAGCTAGACPLSAPLPQASCLLSGAGSFHPASPSPRPPPRAHTSQTPGRFLKSQRGGSLLVQGTGRRGSGGGPRRALGPGSREAHRERAGGRAGARAGGGRGPPAVTWRRPRCPPRRSCPPPPSSGRPCSASALFSSSRTSPPSAPR